MRKIEQGGDWFGLLHFGKKKKFKDFFFERSEINLTKISLQSFPNSEKITDSCVIELLKLSPKKEFEKEIQKENYFEIRKKVEKSETKKALITGQITNINKKSRLVDCGMMKGFLLKNDLGSNLTVVVVVLCLL